MAFFTEQMEMLTNELRTSTRERASFVSHVQDLTHKHLADAQTFMHTVAQEHGAMAEDLRDTLATNRREQSEAVAALRDAHREELQTMRQGLQELLTQTRQRRQEDVAELRVEFHSAQKELSDDLRQAAQVWGQRSQTRTTKSHAGRHRHK